MIGRNWQADLSWFKDRSSQCRLGVSISGFKKGSDPFRIKLRVVGEAKIQDIWCV